ncbi:uncharacterized protein E0L32_005496 [Thyridium curvatum]|uniref:Uncharacterized protein n=1 Tax=Thyridium curvatum TaxID=1093900 RepID=A0A507BCI5_9PEZI|nr:uncharacterized protein E0L32_005496 [Thyridium curvatum]TPX14300.1 hypothetical protein E0L32_005496 [Thyridium curvatum]
MLRGGPAPTARGHDSPSSGPPEGTRRSYQDYRSHGSSAYRHSQPALAPEAPGHRHPTGTFDDSRFSPIQEYHSSYTDAGYRSPSSSHLRHQSFPNLLPAVLRSRSTSPVRREEQRPVSEDMSFTGDARRSARGADGGAGGKGGLAGWFSGTPTGSPSRAERGTPGSRSPSSPTRNLSPEGTPTKSARGTNAAASDSVTPTPASAKSRFAFLTSSMSATLSRLTQAPTSPTIGDELIDLNIEAALFPQGAPTERDTFSPAAFKNLQANATGVLTKMQHAYRERTVAMHDLQADRDAQREELEEANTRAQHLKMQLEGMARKAAEQEQAMQALVAELNAEKKARAEEQRRMREKGLVVPVPLSEGSMVSEDLGVEDDAHKRKWRKSDGSYDTDEDSVEGESIFSRSRSPTSAVGNYESGAMSGDAAAPVSHPRVAALGSQTPQQAKGQKAPPQLNALQKLVKNVTGTGPAQDDEDAGSDGCRNCRGRDASVAWDTVSLLRDENKQLKQRVGQLENAVEGALDLANGVGLNF